MKESVCAAVASVRAGGLKSVALAREGVSTDDKIRFIDVFKGILVALVVLGHNTLFSREFSLLFSGLYNFHVACFLMLVFINPAPSSWSILGNRAVRYLVPQFVFFLLACCLYYFIFQQQADAYQWLRAVAVAIVVSSEEAYKNAVGLRIFWFLPALTALLCLRFVYSLAPAHVRRVVIAGLCIVHCTAGLIPRPLLPCFPWSTPLILFLFPLGLIMEKLWCRYHERRALYWVASLIFFPAICISIAFKSFAGFAGDPNLFSIVQPVQLIFHDLLLVASFFSLIGIAKIIPGRLLAFLGKKSLFIFLTHTFIWQGLIISGLVGWLDQSLPPVVSLPLAFMLTMTVAVAGALLLEGFPVLYSSVFPRDFNSWPLNGQRAA